tara:strand:- start:93 stop:380 length:288 start_codon:yes stop_codon:yes gene_type:complete
MTYIILHAGTYQNYGNLMNNHQPTNSNILDPKCGPLGFIVGDWNDINSFYAAVPCGKGLMVIHQGKQLKKCRNSISARNFIEKYRKKRSVARLPV